MPLDAPVTIAARSAMAAPPRSPSVLWRGIPSHAAYDCRRGVRRPLRVPRSPCSRPASPGRRLRRLRQARQPAAAARADRPAGRLPLGERQDARRAASMADAEGPILAPSVSVLQQGTNRYGFALFDAARKQITGAQVALYTAQPTARACAARTSRAASRWPSSRSSRARRRPPIPTRPRASTSPTCPSKRTASTASTAIAQLDGRLLVTQRRSASTSRRAARSGPPRPAATGARRPHADAAGRRRRRRRDSTRARPSPRTCCRPTSPTSRQEARRHLPSRRRCCARAASAARSSTSSSRSRRSAPKDDVAFIHQEIYKDNRVDQGCARRSRPGGCRPSRGLFVIDRNGKVVHALRGRVLGGELQRAVDKVA